MIQVGMHSIVNQSKSNMYLNVLMKVLSISPWIHIVLFYSYAVKIGLDVGHIPYYNNPDPSYLYQEHRLLIDYAFSISLGGILLGLIVLLGYPKKVVKNNAYYIAFFLVGILIFMYDLVLSPLGLWYYD